MENIRYYEEKKKMYTYIRNLIFFLDLLAAVRIYYILANVTKIQKKKKKFNKI